MRMSLDNMVIQLAEKKILTLRNARDIRIECNAGVVWITIEGQPGDFLLEKGEHLLIISNGPVFIQGMPYGLVKVVCAASSDRQVSLFSWPIEGVLNFVKRAALLQCMPHSRHHGFFNKVVDEKHSK